MPSLGKRLTVCMILLGSVFILPRPTPPLLSPVVNGVPSEYEVLTQSKPSPLLQDLNLSRYTSVTQRLSEGAIHLYGISLKMGDFLHVMVDQDSVKGQEIDIALLLYNPLGGEPLFKVDSPTDEFGSEEVFLLADTSGQYRMEVVGLGKAGIYRIRVQTVRPAMAEDLANVQAAALFRHAEELAWEQPPNPSQAIQEYLQAESLWSSAGNKRWQAQALERIAEILQPTGDWQRILDLQNQALDLCRSVNDPRCVAKLLGQAGVTQRRLGKLEAAERSYRQAAKISRERGYVTEGAESLMNLGNLLQQRGDAWNALGVLERSLMLWSKRQRIDNQIKVMNSLGIVYSSLGKYHVGMRYFQDADRLLGSQPAVGLRAQISTRISEIYQKKGDTDLALAYAQRSLTFRRRAGDLRGEAVSLNNLSLIYRTKRDLAQARDLQEQALAIFRRLSDVRAEASARYNLGLILIDQEDPLRASEQFDQAALLAQRQQFIEGRIMALYGKALAEKMRGNSIAARSVLELVLKLIETGPKAAPSDGFETPYMVARQGSYELMIDLLITSPASYTSEADKIRSFEVSELARWRLLLDALTVEQEREGLLKPPDRSLRAEYEDVKRKLEATEQERKLLVREGLPTARTSARQSMLSETLGALEDRLRLGDGSNSGRAAPVSLAEAQKLLDSDTILLEYFLGKKRSFLWLVTPSSLEVFELPGRSAIEDKVRQLHGLLSKSRSQRQEMQAELLARDLSAILLGPIADRLGTKRLLLVPHGVLHYVPFSVLTEPSQLAALGGETNRRSYLIEWHQIVYEPSASVLRAIRAEISGRTPPSGLLAVLADPVFSSEEYLQLPHSRTEAEEILALVPEGEKTLRALGKDANRELALSGGLGNYKYIHFAAHGENHPERPELSGIVLSQSDSQGRPLQGELRLQDIKNLDLPVELVVLSACKTAIGFEIQGEGFVALPQGFMQAGAARVIVSLWNVKDDSTAALMKHFYQALLAEGQPPSEALRTAQLRMLRNSKWRSPYYWAGFEIQGEWR